MRVIFAVPARIIFLMVMMAGLLLPGCGNHVYHRVSAGDTLYSISWRYGQDYRQIAEWNHLKSPYVISDGQWLRVAPPLEDDAGPPQSSPEPGMDAPRTKITSVPENSPPPINSEKKPRRQAPVSVSSATPAWVWPVRGEILQSFSSTGLGKKGVDIGGYLGQPVHAAAAGRVVYAGDGLPKYGNLIIIKHNDSLLSAYGYNRSLHVKEQEEVTAGQRIADMGSNGKGPAMLHFEIRLDGTPVDPLRYLPR